MSNKTHSNLLISVNFRWWKHKHCRRWVWDVMMSYQSVIKLFIVNSYWFSYANYTLNWWFSRLDPTFFFVEGRGEGGGIWLPSPSAISVQNTRWRLACAWMSIFWLMGDDSLQNWLCRIYHFCWYENKKKWDNNTNTVASQTRPMEAVGSNCQLCHFAVGFNKKRIIFNLITLNFFWKSTTILIISNGILLCFTGSWINQKIAIWS